MLRMYRETFWVAVSAAAPVIALAVVVAYSDMRREEALFMRQLDPMGLPVWKTFSASEDKSPPDARRAGRWSRTGVGLHLLNILGQTTVLAFSLTSLAQRVNEMPLALAIAVEVGGLLALLGAAVAAERAMSALYDQAWVEAQNQGSGDN
jgi:hypothetical protein